MYDIPSFTFHCPCAGLIRKLKGANIKTTTRIETQYPGNILKNLRHRYEYQFPCRVLAIIRNPEIAKNKSTATTDRTSKLLFPLCVKGQA